jgi:translation initiation factor 1 (eIF-1/SUI1)
MSLAEQCKRKYGNGCICLRPSLKKGRTVKTVQVVPRADIDMKLLLKEMERHLQSGGTTFYQQREVRGRRHDLLLLAPSVSQCRRPYLLH